MSDTPTKSPWPIELLRILVWPLTVLFLVVSFWTPLQKVFALLPTMFEKLEAISVGGVTFNVRSALVQATPNDVKLVLPRLTPAGIQYILENGESGITRNTGSVLKVEEQELVQAGLCRELSQEDLKRLGTEDRKEDPNPTVYHSGIDCGDSYDSTRRFLLDLIPELVRQATATPLEATSKPTIGSKKASK